MKLISFKDWLVAKEDSAFGRARKAAALGLGPDIPDAAINSRNTAPPWQQEAFAKKRKKKGKGKKKVTEKTEPVVHHELDSWLKSADNLKRDLDKLKDKLGSLGATTQKVTVKGKEPDKEEPSKDVKKQPPKPTKPGDSEDDTDEQEPEVPEADKSKPTKFSMFVAKRDDNDNKKQSPKPS